MRRQVIGLALILAGLASGMLWATGRISQPFAPAVALLLFLAGTSFFGSVSRFAERMRQLQGKSVRVQVWGSDLPGAAGAVFTIQSIRAIGPGLHLYLRPLPGGAPRHLKIAQPVRALMRDGTVEVGDAKYVQWDGRKVKKTEGTTALLLVLSSEGATPLIDARPHQI